MPDQQVSEIKTTLAIFRSMIADHQVARARLIAHQSTAAWDAARVEKALDVNARTVAALQRAVAVLEPQLHELERALRS